MTRTKWCLVLAVVYASLPFRTALAQNADWMARKLNNGVYLSDVTLPGTHDSAATRDGWAPNGTAAAQTFGITSQLHHGIRFLDLRFRGDGTVNGLVPAHGPVVQPGTAKGIFKEIAEFLEDHPGEMIIISIKHEKNPINPVGALSDAEFARRMQLVYDIPINRVMMSWTETVPVYTRGHTLSMPMPARIENRVVLIRRYPGARAQPYGLDGTSGWPDNASGSVGDALIVQDRYKFRCFPVTSPCIRARVGEKVDHVNEALVDGLVNEGGWRNVRTWASRKRLRLNYASATMLGGTPLPVEDAIPVFASRVNPWLERFARAQHGGAGVVILDREHPRLIDALIDMNDWRPFEYGVGGRVAIRHYNGSVLYQMPSGRMAELGGRAVGSGTATEDVNGRIWVFVVGTDRGLYASRQTIPGSNLFTEFQDLGGELMSNPESVRLCMGAMQVFARGMDGALWTKWQQSGSGGWSAWTSLGGKLTSRPIVYMNGCDVIVKSKSVDGNWWFIRRDGYRGRWGNWYRN